MKHSAGMDVCGVDINQNHIHITMKKLLAFAVTTLFAVSLSAGEYPDISIKELKEQIAAKKVTVIDVMSAKSFAKGHVPTAISYAKSGKSLAKLLPKDKDALIVAYCGGPKCKAYKRAADLAAKLGYTNVKHMSAGISGWKSAGEKVEKAN
tara:strand:+ start:541 stop:993 length:453 start_codon:yes stop_codon:yes gene_type:complete